VYLGKSAPQRSVTRKKGKFVPVHAIKAYSGVEVYLHAFLTSRPGHFTRGKEPRCPLNKSLGGSKIQSGRSGEEEI
jgi:hypothetical protein